MIKNLSCSCNTGCKTNACRELCEEKINENCTDVQMKMKLFMITKVSLTLVMANKCEINFDDTL